MEPGVKRTDASSEAQEISEPELPPKPLSPLEASRQRGFYPITWRVIGGGVLMGVNKSNTEQSHAPPKESTFSEPSPGSTGQSLLRSPAPAPLTLNVDVHEVPKENSPRMRARANSIPSTPSITQVDATALFAAAESP
ncbi:hypothetical protein VNI00_014861 [Paramarasmius palmivorus]|uniref:Uncharacterized protein n=1 Tax=Paramarasmius palmivorus TaxID=297713 RepID=A0AAW0BQU8_9AGAR